jgi:hypothetical protein
MTPSHTPTTSKALKPGWEGRLAATCLCSISACLFIWQHPSYRVGDPRQSAALEMLSGECLEALPLFPVNPHGGVNSTQMPSGGWMGNVHPTTAAGHPPAHSRTTIAPATHQNYHLHRRVGVLHQNSDEFIARMTRHWTAYWHMLAPGSAQPVETTTCYLPCCFAAFSSAAWRPWWWVVGKCVWDTR